MAAAPEEVAGALKVLKNFTDHSPEATEEALMRGYNVWVDSTMKNEEWWSEEIGRIQKTFPHKLCILHVTANWPAVQQRGLALGARSRSLKSEARSPLDRGFNGRRGYGPRGRAPVPGRVPHPARGGRRREPR